MVDMWVYHSLDLFCSKNCLPQRKTSLLPPASQLRGYCNPHTGLLVITYYDFPRYVYCSQESPLILSLQCQGKMSGSLSPETIGIKFGMVGGM